MFTKNTDGNDTIRLVRRRLPRLRLALGTITAAALLWGFPTWYRKAFLNKYREPTTVRVSPLALSINGKVLAAADIHRVIVRSHLR